ncbi:MAG TPA: BON domain-containing protein [Terriglobales bacterium]|nr:BON domain-containing protein [Terriglobales bacterium]
MSHRRLIAITAAACLPVLMAGCSRSAASNQDQALNQQVQAKLDADTALQGAGVKASTENAVVTLTGNVPTEAARVAAAQDAQVPGVNQVNNEIATRVAASEPAPGPAMAMKATAEPSASRARAQPAAPAAPATVEISSGTDLHVRLSQALNSTNAQAGQTWQGQISEPVRVNGEIAVPQGAAVSGTIVAADAAGHFKGQSRLVLKLTALEFNGASYDLASKDVTRLSSSRGTRSAETIGGGAAVGALIGALAGHGKGAAIGAVAGAGAGTAAQAMTKAPEVNLPAETVMAFTLSEPLKVVPAASAH